MLPMETQFWANVAWQENANDNIANGKPTLSQNIHVVWVAAKSYCKSIIIYHHK